MNTTVRSVLPATSEAAILIRKQFPGRVRVIEHKQIPLSDGVMLAAKIWLPAGRPSCAVMQQGLPPRTCTHPRSRDSAETPDDIDQAVAGSREFLCWRCRDIEQKPGLG